MLLFFISEGTVSFVGSLPTCFLSFSFSFGEGGGSLLLGFPLTWRMPPPLAVDRHTLPHLYTPCTVEVYYSLVV